MQMGSFASRRPAAGNLPHFSLPSTASDVPRQTAVEHFASSETSSLKPGSGWSGTAQTSPSSVSPSGYILGPAAPPTDTRADRVQSQDMYGMSSSWQLGPSPAISPKPQNMPSEQHEQISHSHNPNSPRPPDATSDHRPPSVSGLHRDTRPDFQGHGGLLSDALGYATPRQPNYGYKPPYAMPGAVMSNIHQPGTPLTMFGGMSATPRSPASWPPNMRPPIIGSNLNRGHGAMPYPMAQPGPLGDRLFKCDQCPQSFNRNHDLKRHKRIHLAVKPFPCGDCDKSFSRKDALKVSKVDYNRFKHHQLTN